MRNGRNLVDDTQLLNVHPELKANTEGIRALFGMLTFAQRMQKGYTQSDLALRSGLSLKKIVSLESGTGDFGILTYEQLFEALELSPIDVGNLMTSIGKRNE